MKLVEKKYDPKIYALNVKTITKKVDHITTLITYIPRKVLKEHNTIILCIDVIFINGIKG